MKHDIIITSQLCSNVQILHDEIENQESSACLQMKVQDSIFPATRNRFNDGSKIVFKDIRRITVLKKENLLKIKTSFSEAAQDHTVKIRATRPRTSDFLSLT
ncbi:hypothetical protein LSTR_LSTR000040 [Laodelphax striatellus]|uniref:Uncharacterized protein n=1 Tax=Laodelphax striatellus TaxID=195883 RepID=A0A482X6R0_LAOST|nr:hypothetical protein LSTR_LSTR000040 [Laodelphax striatellus]